MTPDENKDVSQTTQPEVPATPEEAPEKPVGPATIVGDDPVDQFPAHDENISSQ